MHIHRVAVSFAHWRVLPLDSRKKLKKTTHLNKYGPQSICRYFWDNNLELISRWKWHVMTAWRMSSFAERHVARALWMQMKRIYQTAYRERFMCEKFAKGKVKRCTDGINNTELVCGRKANQVLADLNFDYRSECVHSRLRSQRCVECTRYLNVSIDLWCSLITWSS